MTWCATSLDHVRSDLQMRMSQRMDAGLYEAADLIRVPVVFIWAPDHLPKARETVAAHGYWNDESAHYLDIAFFGWMFERPDVAVFDPDAYQQCTEEVRHISTWRPSGDIDFLLLDFELETRDSFGSFNFSESVPLPIGQMIDQGQVANIQVFAQELINQARAGYVDGDTSSIWQIQQRIALDRARRSVWKWISATFLKDAGQIYDDMRPYAVCNLAKPVADGGHLPRGRR
jgi:hypothetical protein